MSMAKFIVGDTRDVVATLAENSVDLILTSPPFLALRSYLPADHPDKHREIGSEATPAEFLDVLLELTAEWGRVLAPHGSIAIELGDTYSGSGGAGGDYTDTGLRAGQEKFDGSALQHRRTAQRNRDLAGWPMDKSLALIPELYRIALAYGINPLTGQPSPAGRWRVRNVIRWHRPNPPVGALGDKFRPATSDLVIATRSRTRYFDLDAVRDRTKEPNTTPRAGKKEIANPDRKTDTRGTGDNPAGAPPLDTWIIPTSPYRGSHYATFPPELCVKPIKSMVPEKVCTECGEPSRRIIEVTGLVDRDGKTVERKVWASGIAEGKAAHSNKTTSGTTTTTTTTGWTDCGHDAWRTGVCFDPFAGSGTTLMVATGHGRDAIGIDLDARNADLARERVGMFLEVEDRREAVA